LIIPLYKKANMRIQKYLSLSGIASRREAERWIQNGWIYLNGQVVTEQGIQIDPDHDTVSVKKPDDAPQHERKIIAFHKPIDVVTNCPQNSEKEIKDLLPPAYQLFNTIGRLDKASEGLILLTNDGIVSQKLLDPKHPHERTYEVTLNAELPFGAKSKLESGLTLFGQKTKPLKIRNLAPQLIEMTMTEGKNRQIRRMIQKVGLSVLKLKRIAFGPIELKGIPIGQYRELSEIEIQSLLDAIR